MRFLWFLFSILLVLMLSTCCASQTGAPDGDWFTDTLKTRDKLLECLSSGDSDGIKELLCDKLRNKENIDKEISDSIAFFGGKVLSYDKEKSGVNKTGGSKNDGKWVQLDTSGVVFDIYTETGKHLEYLYVSYVPVDAESPENAGIIAYSIKEAGKNGVDVSLE